MYVFTLIVSFVPIVVAGQNQHGCRELNAEGGGSVGWVAGLFSFNF
jgi:hypothetical protein